MRKSGQENPKPLYVVVREEMEIFASSQVCPAPTARLLKEQYYFCKAAPSFQWEKLVSQINISNGKLAGASQVLIIVV